ncbi:hypothetical protein EVAR_88379_1 [Eumeta japonica]|uniref:Uncharacterized protein n=1 Tax=Eumeta variegata TaxID=151549 RepID=A0A4C1XA12_EUMVA|nr:hypothetical protein EVAR_88379_1 [Eumeta japonica]
MECVTRPTPTATTELSIHLTTRQIGFQNIINRGPTHDSDAVLTQASNQNLLSVIILACYVNPGPAFDSITDSSQIPIRISLSTTDLDLDSGLACNSEPRIIDIIMTSKLRHLPAACPRAYILLVS